MPELAVSYSARELSTPAGGPPAILLEHPGNVSGEKPHLVSAEVLPGRGMNVSRLDAYLPGRGIVNLLHAGPAELAAEDPLRYGAALLFPFAGRVRGRRTVDPKVIETTILGHRVALPANGRGRSVGAERCALGGLMLDAAMERVEHYANEHEAGITAYWDAGDFHGRWPSRAFLTVSVVLRERCFGLRAVVENIGAQDLPVGFGWHACFDLPSAHREQARLHMAARHRVAFNNDDDQFPTGQLLPVHATPYDFSNADGVTIDGMALEDCFVDLGKNPKGHAICELLDPAERCGIRVTALSPEVNALEIQAPVDRGYFAIQPQFNWPDPFNPVWGRQHTGMLALPPGKSAAFSVQVDIFATQPFTKNFA